MFIKQQNTGIYNINKGPQFAFDCKLHSQPFTLNGKWYLRILIPQDKIDELKSLDTYCENYIVSRNKYYRRFIFENTILIKIPYRYKKFEVTTNNCTMYDLRNNDSVHVSFDTVAIGIINDNAYVVHFKLNLIKLYCETKHPHAPRLCEEC